MRRRHLDPTLRLAVFTGHSGGHVFPAMAFAEKFRQTYPGCRIDLITSRKAPPSLLPQLRRHFDEIRFLPDFPFAGLRGKEIWKFIFRLPQAFWMSWNCLSKTKPDLCIGFGSYVSYPGMLLAKAFGIPSVLHEQNFRGGKANEALIKHMDAVTVSFEKTWRGKKLKSRHWVGLPIRSSLVHPEQERKRTGPNRGDAFRLLVLGGSQGAHRLNEMILDAFRLLDPEEKSKMAVKHITGRTDFQWVKTSYQDLNISAHTYPFHTNMTELYRSSDLAVTRAGANTLFELALFRLPAVVVPYPYADAHQRENADYFESRGGVIMREESDLTPEGLVQDIRSFMRHPDQLKRFADNMEELAVPDAANRLVDVTKSFLRKEVHANH